MPFLFKWIGRRGDSAWWSEPKWTWERAWALPLGYWLHHVLGDMGASNKTSTLF